jgi:tripartite-type tricarboxylate transporter receptor subunit TctC
MREERVKMPRKMKTRGVAGFVRAAMHAALYAAALTICVDVQAQGWPSKPVDVVIPFAAGGPGDAIGRLFGEKLSRIWGQPVLADNRPGAGGNLASEFTARRPTATSSTAACTAT